VQFDLKDLRGFLLCIKNNNLQYIRIEQNSFELMVNREIMQSNNYTLPLLKNSSINKSNDNCTHVTSNPSEQIFSNTKQLVNSNQRLDNYFTIVSPMVGTFYRSSAPNEPYFIELYDQVEKYQTVCIIEAMKLMNEIEAEISGNVVEILVKDGDIVDSGQALMKIRSPKP
jgi:acetyl-CoA carboxylase biotin carboxyl carrier protein